MDEFRRVCHKSFLKQNAGFLLDRDEYAYASDREKKNLLESCQCQPKRQFHYFHGIPCRFKNAQYMECNPFFLLVAFEFYYFTRKNTEEWIILHCDFICSNSPYLSSSRLIWPGER
jgi:hypothetical protein